jgi:hypothetical protein
MRSATSRMRLSWVTSRIVVPCSAPAPSCGRRPRGPTACRARPWARRPAASPARPPARARSPRAGAGRPTAARRACRRARPRPTPRASRRARRRSARGAAGDAQPELDVLERGQRAEQVVLLEDEADPPAHALERRRLRAPRSSSPSTRTLPSCAERSAPTRVSSVVLPEPEGPVTMTISPAGISVDDVEQDLLAQLPGRRSGSALDDDGAGPLIRTPPPGRAAHLAQREQPESAHIASVSSEHESAARSGVTYSGRRSPPRRGRRATRRRERRAGSRARQDRRLLQHDAGDEAVAVADRAQRRVLGEVLETSANRIW